MSGSSDHDLRLHPLISMKVSIKRTLRMVASAADKRVRLMGSCLSALMVTFLAGRIRVLQCHEKRDVVRHHAADGLWDPSNLALQTFYYLCDTCFDPLLDSCLKTTTP